MVTWDDSTAFITGGGQGIGLGIARALARKGVRLALADVDAAALQAARAELADLVATETYVLDVRDRDALAATADQVESALGPVSLLFNNAGVAPIIGAIQATYADWDWTLGVNLVGVVNGVQTFLPRMVARGQGGHIVNTASGAGLVAGPGALYTTSKFAVVGLSESLRLELAAHGIGVSVLVPAAVDTSIINNSQGLHTSEAMATNQEAAAASIAFLKTGVSIDAVGERVVEAMEGDRMWIHTDTTIRPHLAQRCEDLLASFPS